MLNLFFLWFYLWIEESIHDVLSSLAYLLDSCNVFLFRLCYFVIKIALIVIRVFFNDVKPAIKLLEGSLSVVGEIRRRVRVLVALALQFLF
jgi:hypothetical protein